MLIITDKICDSSSCLYTTMQLKSLNISLSFHNSFMHSGHQNKKNMWKIFRNCKWCSTEY